MSRGVCAACRTVRVCTGGRGRLSRGVRVDVVVDGHGLDEARLPREDDEVEDGAGEVEPPADEPVDDRGLDLVRAVLGRRREAVRAPVHKSTNQF